MYRRFKNSIFVLILFSHCCIDILTPNKCAGGTLALSTEITKVAVIGTTGRLGREAVKQLSQQGIATRCLVRKIPESSSTTTNTNDKRDEIVSYLRTLPGVELIPGDINDQQ